MSEDDLRFQYLGDIPSSDVPKLSLIVCSAMLHSLYYRILPSSFAPILKSDIISTSHALISVMSVCRFLFQYPINLKEMNRIVGGGVDGTGDEMMIYNICYSSGYFLYDFILMIKEKSVRRTSSIVHHVIIFVTFLLGLYGQICHPCHFYSLFEELSTIPLNFKAMYRNNPRLHHFFSILFVSCFFVSRLFYGSTITFYALRLAPRFLRLCWTVNDMFSFYLGLGQAILCISTRLLNFYWTYLIFRKIFSPMNKIKK